MTALSLLIVITAFFGSYFGVEAFRKWTSRREILDLPNERSLHDGPIPRGGGAVIVVLCLIAFVVISLFQPDWFSWGYLLGALLIAAISWLDDLYSISFAWRFLLHVTAAILIVSDVGGFRELSIPAIELDVNLGLAGDAIAVFWIVWLINAYNFMDGIDGIAGIQAAVAAAGWATVAILSSLDGMVLFSGVLGAACLGFLFHNWHPARIFLGDVGSAFLGLTFASMPLLAAREATANAAEMPILGAAFVLPFLFDAVLTLLRRLFRGDRIWEAHREHLYQKMVISGIRHDVVALGYGAAAAVLTIAALAAFKFAGIFEVLLLLLAGLAVFLMFILDFSKKGIDLST